MSSKVDSEKYLEGKKLIYFLSSIIALALAFIFSLGVGPVHVRNSYILWTLARQIGLSVPNLPYSDFIIISQLREPQIVGGLFIGASLAVGGAVVQSIFRNPISEPYITGVSSGATLGAVVSIVFGITFFGVFTLPFMAFIFSMGTVLLVYMLSIRKGRTPPIIFLLTGIAISLFASSLVALLLYSKPALENRIFFWVLGSISGVDWLDDLIIVPLVLITTLIVGAMYRELNALQMGDVHARSVGINPERSKLILITLSTVSVAACVSVSGLIGFVGLIFPHISRMLYGGSNKYVIPSSAILGGTFLILCNDLAHSIVAGEVIPIGIITGIIGVPFFMFLMMRINTKGYYGS